MNKKYESFVEWAEARGIEFPVTATEFYSLAAKYAEGNNALIDLLCQQGISPDWREG